MSKKLGMIMVVLIAAASLVYGDSVRTWSAEDAAPAFRVKNTGNENVYFVIGETAIVVTNGTEATSCSMVGAVTIAEVAALIEACENSSSKLTLSVDYDCALGADVATSNLVNEGVVIMGNNHFYNTVGKWDVSDVLHFDTYNPGFDVGGVGDVKAVARIFGDIGGTGNITISGYCDGTEVYQKTLLSPVYYIGEGGVTNTWTADNTSPGILDIELDLPVARTEGILFRATRATTATTGGMGMVIDLINK